MAGDLTPVEAISLEQAAFLEKKALLRNPACSGITIAVLLYEALIELAKADAQHGDLNRITDSHPSVVAARSKLYEALQR